MEPTDNASSSSRDGILQFNIRKLLFGLLLIVAFVILLIITERATGIVFFMKMEKKVALLKDLNDLAQNGVLNNPELKPIYLSAVSELGSYDAKPLLVNWVGISPLINLKIPENVVKFFSGSLVGFLVALSGLYARKEKRNEWLVILISGVLLGILLGYVAILIPTIYSPWLNYLAFPAIQVIVIFMLLKMQRKR